LLKNGGHDVVLAEKERRLGGQLNYAWKSPGNEIIEKLIDHLCNRVEKLKIRIHLGKEVNRDFVQQIDPEVIVLATGSKLTVPQIFGIGQRNVFLATEILDGKEPLGKRAIVIGGGQTGLETADFLSEIGQEVTVLEMLSGVARDMSPRNRIFLMQKISEKNIQILVNRVATGITNEGVMADHFGRQEEFKGETVVLAVGSKPERDLLRELEEIIPTLEGVYLVGDCIEPKSALEAIYEGDHIARDI
jgi:pyruvate/2-oxoglutarate dehydrogenase complex dihydrolipoamide dehydrogenase (E3) component